MQPQNCRIHIVKSRGRIREENEKEKRKVFFFKEKREAVEQVEEFARKKRRRFVGCLKIQVSVKSF